MVHHCICIRSVCTVCVCMQSGIVNHAECALALPPLSCPCVPLGVQPLMAINTREVFCTHTFTLKPNTGQQSNLLVSPEKQPKGCINTSFWWISMKRMIDASLKSFQIIIITQIHNCWDCGCLLVSCNVGVWILRSETEFTRMQPSTSLCVHSLFLSRMQRAAGLDRGWGKWAECIRVLSPCGVIVDRDGSRSERGQRRGNTSSHHRTWGWQLFGLHRYCCCFLMILNVSLHTYISH